MSDKEAQISEKVKTFSPEGQEAAKRIKEIYVEAGGDKESKLEKVKEFCSTLPPPVIAEIATLQMFNESA